MKRPAFTSIEMLITIGVMAVVLSLTIPLYRDYQIRSDLDNSAQLATQGLSRAKLLSQLGQRDSQWGYYVPAGILYKGSSYALRDPAFDEVYPMPSTIAVSGLLDVNYSRVDGVPLDTGNIVLKALNSDERVIQVSIAVDKQSLATNEGDVFTICRTLPGGAKETITIPDATWPSYQSQGATMGPCQSSSSSAPKSSSSSSKSSSVPMSSSSSAAGGGGGGSCTAKFTVGQTGMITTTAPVSWEMKNILSQITFGAGGPPVNVHVCYSTNGGSSWSTLSGGNGNCSGNGNAYGNAVAPGGTDIKTVSVATNKQLGLRVHGTYKQQGWLAFDETFSSYDGTGHIKLLKNGDQLQSYSSGFGSQTPLKNYLISKGLANSAGQITMTACQLLLISELGDLGTASSDFQDDVMVMTFN